MLREDNPHNLEQLIRLPGQQYDEESGLYYNRHRYYDPLQGRYITQDPIGLAGRWNFYQYTINPVQQVDPLGLDIWIENQGPGEPALHQSVNVGAPDGSYNSYSYAMGSFPHGEVYNDVKHGGKIEMYKKTTKEQDETFDKAMKAQLGEHGYYGYDDVCRSWSRRQFESAPGNQENPPKRKNVVVIMGGFDLSSKGSSTTGSGTSR